MRGCCGVTGCDSDVRWIRVTQYGEGAALYVCDQHLNFLKLRDNNEADCYAGLPDHSELMHENSRAERIAFASRQF